MKFGDENKIVPIEPKNDKQITIPEQIHDKMYSQYLEAYDKLGDDDRMKKLNYYYFISGCGISEFFRKYKIVLEQIKKIIESRYDELEHFAIYGFIIGKMEENKFMQSYGTFDYRCKSYLEAYDKLTKDEKEESKRRYHVVLDHGGSKVLNRYGISLDQIFLVSSHYGVTERDALYGFIITHEIKLIDDNKRLVEIF